MLLKMNVGYYEISLSPRPYIKISRYHWDNVVNSEFMLLLSWEKKENQIFVEKDRGKYKRRLKLFGCEI